MAAFSLRAATAADVPTLHCLMRYFAVHERAQERFQIPFLYVTHNPTEAQRLGNYVVVLDKGKVKITGLPAEIFNQLTEVNSL